MGAKSVTMIPAYGALALLFTPGAYSQEVNNKEAFLFQVAKFINETKTEFRIDPNNRPYSDIDAREYNNALDGCFEYIGWCTRSKFFNRRFLERIDELDVRAEFNVDHETVGGTSRDSSVTYTYTTAFVKSKTTGWKIGGKISAAAESSGARLKGGLEINAEYSEFYTDQTTDTVAVTRGLVCQPGEFCYFSTASFYAVAKGACSIDRYFTCGGTTASICVSHNWLGCSLFQKYDQECRPTDELHDCEITFPILQSDGKIETIVAPISEKIQVGQKGSTPPA